VVDGVRTVSEQLRAIAQSSGEQSRSMEQVMQSVGNLDDITASNRQLVERSANASQELVDRAAALSDAVSTMRLRQGSADEAYALVQAAVQRVREVGYTSAAAEFRQAGGRFLDRDLYIWVIDPQARYQVHGAKPAQEGKRVHESPGIDGDRFMLDATASAKAGGGASQGVVRAADRTRPAARLRHLPAQGRRRPGTCREPARVRAEGRRGPTRGRDRLTRARRRRDPYKAFQP
jgi:hypothetical protein